MEEQLYLVRRAHPNDAAIVCDRDAFEALIARFQEPKAGPAFWGEVQEQARALDPTSVAEIGADAVGVQVPAFSVGRLQPGDVYLESGLATPAVGVEARNAGALRLWHSLLNPAG